MDAEPFMWPHWLCQCAQTSATVLFAGTATLQLLAWGTDVERFTLWNRLGWASWGVLLVAAVLHLGLTAADMSGLPVSQACSGEVLGSVAGGTVFGAVWKVRMALLAAALIVGLCANASRRRGWPVGMCRSLEVVGAMLATALLGTLIWSGHAHASDRHSWVLPTDLLHVISVGAWPGGLLPLALLLGHVGRDAAMIQAARTVTRRFSLMSGVAVAVLAFSGLITGGGLVGTMPALWRTRYGRLLLCKAGLFAVMIALGATNRRLLAAQTPENDPGTVRRLWRNVTWESALAMVTLLVTELLASSAPPMGSN